MDCNNLADRYDHFTLAGCSLGITLPEMDDWQNKVPDPCKEVFAPAGVHFKCWWEALKTISGSQ